MAIINNLELKEGMYISVIGMNVKNDNGLYMVKNDYSIKDKYAVYGQRVCICKVNLNGEKSKAKYSLNFINEDSFLKNDDLKIKVVTDLKAAKKEVNQYMKEREGNEKIISFKETDKKMAKGSFIKFKKDYAFGMCGEHHTGTNSIWKVVNCSNRLEIIELGKKGQEISTGLHYYLNEKCLEQILNENYIVVLEKQEILKKDKLVAETINKDNDVVKDPVKDDVIKDSEVDTLIKDDVIKDSGNNQIKSNVKDILLNVEKVVLNDDKNGVEIYFSGKPSEEVRDNLKFNGFKWSRFNKCWYATQSEKTINFANSLLNINEEHIKSISEKYKEQKEKESSIKLNEIDINDIGIYIVNDDLSKRENANGFFRKNDIDHTKEIQDYFLKVNNEVINILNSCNDKDIEYKIKISLQRFKRDYFNNYIKRLEHKANNPSWVITGRSGRNINRDNKMHNRYDRLLSESNEIIDKFNKIMNKYENDIRKQSKDNFKMKAETINLDNYKFTKCKKKYNASASSYIFDNASIETTMNNYNDEYYIFKNWGKFRIYNNKGLDIGSANTLKDAKKHLIALLEL